MKKQTIFSVFLEEARKAPHLIIVSTIAAICVELARLAQPVFFKDFVNLLASPTVASSVDQSVVIALYVAGAYIAIFLFSRLRVWTLTEFDATFLKNLYLKAFSATIQKSEHYFTNQFTGTLTRKVNRFPGSVMQVFESIIVSVFPIVISCTIAITVLSLQHIYLGVAYFIWSVVFTVALFILHAGIRPLRKARSKADSQMSGSIADSISNRSTVSQFGHFSSEIKHIQDKTQEWYRASIQLWRTGEFMWLVLGGLQVISQVGMLFLGVYLWQKGLITVGDFVLIHSYLLIVNGRLEDIHSVLKRYLEGVADAQEMIDVMNEPETVTDKPDALQLTSVQGEVAFEKVAFAYGDNEVLSDFSLSIQSGEKVAFVGSSGAGKSTLTKLIMRLYDVTKGSVTVDGVDVRDVTQESLREQIAFVPQEPLLFHRSLMENIRYGKLEASDDEVQEAARRAYCHDFITHTPEGYATLVGERGIKLSGGERQRVAIARAILKNAPILILDEATSSLDSESEQYIQSALKELMEGKTVIAIAHRLSTIMHMDRIVVIENGSVTLTGTHSELLNHEGNIYKKLFEIQAGGFITDDTQ